MDEKLTDDAKGYLRVYIAQLVEIWTALSIVRKKPSSKLISVFRDLCSDKTRNMLHELANKKDWTLGFSREGTEQHKRLHGKLLEANKWFTGYNGRLHYRNCAGSHLQPLDKADHMFQHFGYGGEREWKQLTKGVAACLKMMKGMDDKPYHDFWRQVRFKIRGAVDERAPDLPVSVEALLQPYKVQQFE